MKHAIHATNVYKKYDDFCLDHVCLSVPYGSIVGLIGENGAGKTTLLKSILSTVTPDGGEISVLGEPVLGVAPKEVGVVMGECFFYDHLMPQDVDKILAPIYDTWDSGLFFSYLNQFHVPEKKQIKDLSRGMRVKLSLAAALSHRPKLLILDEATSGLDPVVRSELLDVFLDFVQDEMHAVLLSSHIVSDLEKVCDYIVYLHNGQVILHDEKDQLLSQYGRAVFSRKDTNEIAPDEMIYLLQGEFQCQAIVKNRRDFQQRHPAILVDPISLEDFMLIIGKGEKTCAD